MEKPGFIIKVIIFIFGGRNEYLCRCTLLKDPSQCSKIIAGIGYIISWGRLGYTINIIIFIVGRMSEYILIKRLLGLGTSLVWDMYFISILSSLLLEERVDTFWGVPFERVPFELVKHLLGLCASSIWGDYVSISTLSSLLQKEKMNTFSGVSC